MKAHFATLCYHCREVPEESETFSCEFCAEEEEEIEIVVCRPCSLKHHAFHMSCVKPIVLAEESALKKLSHISRDVAEPVRQRKAFNDEISEKVAKELDVFFGALQQDYRRVGDRLAGVMNSVSITQSAIDEESKAILLDNEIIEKKVHKLDKWKKKLFEIISELNLEGQ
ncbi:hypothetical protein QR680_004351 [Steinernema hermaphroditum]|uniref:Uncharacterized protein n=1 Tax=Steinernema hermaphroditum TaxID=289476 RepID=A0AA39HQM6_9BILA|nr:hypothetical protein QR680_004351 [Steinernema hermaphroditum]